MLNSRRMVLLSPILVIAVGHFTARVGGAWLGSDVWLPLAVVFWSLVGSITLMTPREERRAWLRPSQGAWGWRVLALSTALVVLPLFLMQWRLLGRLTVFVPWLLFGFINPWFEERYWRGTLLDATAPWPAAARIVYTSAFFALSHPLMFGVHSVAVGSPSVLISTFIMGAVWALVALRTRSLRWCMVAHVLVDLWGLSVAVFLNLWMPPGRL